MLCHEDLDEEKPPEKQVASLFVDGEYVATRASALSDEVRFSHMQHANSDQECSACHVGIETSERIGPEMRSSMDACSKCHESKGMPTTCASCHTEIDENWAPPEHAHEWRALHGAVYRSQPETNSGRCTLCHTESSCTACHQQEAPQSHNNYWRRRGHGVASSIDRSSCATCHRTDFCDRCHAEATPLSHMGMWGSTQNNHCQVCHFPLNDTSCIVCHKGTPSHGLAAPRPPPPHPPAGSNCRQCHGITAPLPHPDPGIDCNFCHM